MSSSSVVIDASLVYGAARFIRNNYHRSAGEKPVHSKESDQALFYEFLHYALLYETIIMDNSSVSIIGKEITELIEQVNERPRLPWRSEASSFFHTKELTDLKLPQLSYIKNRVCKLASLVDNELLSRVEVPWAYKNITHHDYHEVASYASEHGLAESLIPATIFAYRAICYAAFARGHAKKTSIPTAYVASPGRLSVLEILLDSRTTLQIRQPRQAYTDLLSYLNLPEDGYDFSDFTDTFGASDLSPLTLHIQGMSPLSGLKEVLEMRTSKNVQGLRQQWHDRLFSMNSTFAFGNKNIQVINNSTIQGDANMYMIARPA